MRTRLAIASLTAVLVLVAAGCGGGSGSDGSKDDGGSGASTTAASTDSGGSNSDDGGSKGGDVDCAAVTKAAQDLLQVQLMAQIKDPEVLSSMKSGTIGHLDPEQFLASMKVLHQLDGHGSAPFGDPKDSIDAYESAAQQVQKLLGESAPTQSELDSYNASIGTVGEFLGKQTAISAAMEDAGC